VRRGARVALYGGIVATVVGLSVYHARVLAEPRYDYLGEAPRTLWSLLYVSTLLVVAYGLGLPELPRSPGRALLMSVVAAASGAFVVSIIQLVLGDALLPRFVVFGSAVLLVPWYLLCAGIAVGNRQTQVQRDRVLLVGTPDEAAPVRVDLRRAAERAAAVAGVLLPVEAGQHTGKPPADGPLVRKAMELNASVIVLNRTAESDDSVVDQAAELHGRGLRVRSYAQFTDEWLGKVPLTDLERASLLFDVGEVHRARYGRVKRLVDVSIGLVGVLLFGLIVPCVLVGNLLANRGPLLFGQSRVGKGGCPFRILKFRTMEPQRTSAGSHTTVDDPRVTTFGGFLRKTHLDELPQAWNVLKGDLSVVGPRPEQPRYVETFSAALPFYDLRHLVRPGITGWAQVKYHYGLGEEDAREKLQYEFWYLSHQSMSVDFRVIGRTLRSVIGGEGR
jgi:lipopolysaccharide/colanic/teichoic acid biosynthesis glycosyltransferase